MAERSPARVNISGGCLATDRQSSPTLATTYADRYTLDYRQGHDGAAASPYTRVQRVRCLALNASFEPLTLVPVRRALRLVLDGKAEIVAADGERVVRSAHLRLPHPAVIRLVKFVHVPRRFRRQVTNTFLFARDAYRCQYCGRSPLELRSRESLTRDHLVPLSRGGTNGWTNCVTACSTCNTRKGNLLPAEAGMHPRSAPVEPHFVHLSWAVRRLTPTQAHYIEMFYGSDVLATLRTL